MSKTQDMTDIHTFLEECVKQSGCFTLVTVDGDAPASRPVSFHMLIDGIEYFGVGTFKDVYKQLQVNPHVQMLGWKGADWIRVSGIAVFDDDPTLFEKAVETMPFLTKIYNKETVTKLGIFHLENGSAQFTENMMNVTKTVEF